MKQLFTCLLFFTALTSYSQDFMLGELQGKHTELQEKIASLEDSLEKVENLIATFPIKEVNEPVWAYTREGAELRKEPNREGPIALSFERTTKIQVIDLVGQFYLACSGGSCGYIYKSFIKKDNDPVSALTSKTRESEPGLQIPVPTLQARSTPLLKKETVVEIEQTGKNTYEIDL